MPHRPCSGCAGIDAAVPERGLASGLAFSSAVLTIMKKEIIRKRHVGGFLNRRSTRTGSVTSSVGVRVWLQTQRAYDGSFRLASSDFSVFIQVYDECFQFLNNGLCRITIS